MLAPSIETTVPPVLIVYLEVTITVSYLPLLVHNGHAFIIAIGSNWRHCMSNWDNLMMLSLYWRLSLVKRGLITIVIRT